MSGEENDIEFSEEDSKTVKVIVEKKGDKGKEGTEEELESLKRNNENLNSMVELVAEQKFNEKRAEIAKELGLDESEIDSPEQLKAFQSIIDKNKVLGKKKTGAGGVPLTGAQTGEGDAQDPNIPLAYRTYDSQIEAVLDIQNEARNSKIPEIKRDAQKTLSQLWKKSLKSIEGGEAVFEGEITKAIQFKAVESPEEKEARKQEASKWTIKK